MSEKKHTPGNWYIKDVGCECSRETKIFQMVHLDSDLEVCTIYPLYKEYTANLIAGAPDLLEAAKIGLTAMDAAQQIVAAIVKYIGEKYGVDISDQFPSEPLEERRNIIQAAIDNAEGGGDSE